MKGKIINMKKQFKAFTLIELMVVVAVIAILATLSVSNFSAAVKRTRNAGRQADVQAVAKALETCYDVPTGRYSGLGTGTSPISLGSGTASGAFQASTNTCLNEDIVPDMNNYPYSISWVDGPPQRFVVCAALEKVANWENIGNSATTNPSISTAGVSLGTGCSSGSTDCAFCVINQQ